VGGGPSVAEAAVLHRTLAAVTGPAGTILHFKATGVTNGSAVLVDQWRETSPPYASRGLDGQVGDLVEFANDGSTSYLYDTTTNTIYEQPDSRAPTFTDPVSLIRQQLASGQASLVGTTTIGGQSLYQIQLDNGVTAYVDTTSYIPRYVDEPQRNGNTLRLDVVAYEHLAATPANTQLLSITAQHPNAQIDTNPNDWPTGLGN
jgi:hypothetical protein